MKKCFLLPLLLIIVFSSCEIEEQSPDKPEIIRKEKVSGFVQKGPFVSGTTVTMNELNSKLVQTGKVFTSTIINDMGLFEVNNIELISSFVQLSSSGFYFNEVTGEISISPITLTSLSDIGDKNSINVNVLTHLEKRRVETLMKEGKPKIRKCFICFFEANYRWGFIGLIGMLSGGFVCAIPFLSLLF